MGQTLMVSKWRRLLGSPEEDPDRAGPMIPMQRARAIAPASCQTPAASPSPILAGQVHTRFFQFVFDLPDCRGSEPGTAELAMLARLEVLSTDFDIRNLPRPPTVLPQLMRMLKSDDAAGKQWARLVGRDPLMVGEVMRVTRSAMYRSVQPVRSLRHAVILLGQDGLRRVLTEHVMKPVLLDNAGTRSQIAGERLWQHSERCAHACTWLGRYAGCDAFETYLAGIVSHAGAGAMVRLLAPLIPGEQMSVSGKFLDACAQLAAKLTVQAAEYWQLPANVIEALTTRQFDGPARDASPLAKALACADVLAMARLLTEHERLPTDLDLSRSWPEVYAPSLVDGCQQDLRHQFDGSEEPAD
ncbi:MAG: HDOD domain-containing protein [Rhodanobacter sp.]|nr:HDOD domain-containing protein [Rhodanobacter sp.]